MATAVRNYTALTNIKVDACGLNSGFDTLYSTINDLDSANMAHGFYPESSQTTIVDTASNYASTEVEAALGEPTSLQRGLNTIHVVPQYTNAMVVFPGKVEIRGQICVVSEKFTVSGVLADDSATRELDMFIICGQPAAGEEITGSDLFLCRQSSVIVSSCYDTSAMGYYYYNKRLIGAARNASVAATCQALVGDFNPDPVQRPFNYSTTASELSSLFGITQSSISGTGTTIPRMHTFYKRSCGAYGYKMALRLNTEADIAQQTMGKGTNLFLYLFQLNSRTSYFGSTAVTSELGTSNFKYEATVGGTAEGSYITATPQKFT